MFATKHHEITFSVTIINNNVEQGNKYESIIILMEIRLFIPSPSYTCWYTGIGIMDLSIKYFGLVILKFIRVFRKFLTVFYGDLPLCFLNSTVLFVCCLCFNRNSLISLLAFISLLSSTLMSTSDNDTFLESIDLTTDLAFSMNFLCFSSHSFNKLEVHCRFHIITSGCLRMFNNFFDSNSNLSVLLVSSFNDCMVDSYFSTLSAVSLSISNSSLRSLASPAVSCNKSNLIFKSAISLSCVLTLYNSSFSSSICLLWPLPFKGSSTLSKSRSSKCLFSSKMYVFSSCNKLTLKNNYYIFNIPLSFNISTNKILKNLYIYKCII
ncbi:hypothetical protein AGLY_015418 [Aphis glycines]|uniref:Uncharacterized protein n=1 Tax=Aphis glycines TaxID=307491 RepID=A0A6G0T0L6_APHGL|nr:hypothetical protein AGLY_015418 [Aphis glycines]